MRSQPLTARDFNRWWYALGRYRELEAGDEGRKRIAEDVRTRQALEAEQEAEQTRLADAFTALEGADADDADTLATPTAHASALARQRKTTKVYDPANEAQNATIFTNPAALLALLPPDDPRAIYVRRGGRLDAQGNPLTRGEPRRAALTQTVIITDPQTGNELRHEVVRAPIDPPTPHAPTSPATPTPEPPATIPGRSLLDLSPTLALPLDVE